MSFKVINKTSKSIAIETLELLDHIDQFQYAGLDSYCSLGSIHNNIDVQIVDDIPGKKYETTISIGRLKELIGRLESLAEQEKKQNEGKGKNDQERSHNYSDLLYHYRNILDKYAGQPDSYLIAVTATISVLGYYTRDSSGKPLVVLKWTTDTYNLVTTYIHEMMHAFYDSALIKPMECVPLVEEPLAEMGMLRFVTEFVRRNPVHRVLLRKAIRSVKNKQLEPAIAHYGFGAYLYENYSHIDWENLMYSANGSINATDPQYKSLEAMQLPSFSDSNNYPFTAQWLFSILSLHGSSVISPKPVPYFESDITFHDGVDLTQGELEDILREMGKDSMNVNVNLYHQMFGMLFPEQIGTKSNKIAINVHPPKTALGTEIHTGVTIGNHLRKMIKQS